MPEADRFLGQVREHSSFDPLRIEEPLCMCASQRNGMNGFIHGKCSPSPSTYRL
jgi:hypothetical protein